MNHFNLLTVFNPKNDNSLEKLYATIDQEDKEDAERLRQEDQDYFLREMDRHRKALQVQHGDEEMEHNHAQTSSPFYSSCCGSHLYSENAIEEFESTMKSSDDDAPVLSSEELNAKKLTAILAAKEDGNILFHEKKYNEAMEIYERGKLIIMMLTNASPELAEQIFDLEIQLNLNISLCELKLGKPYRALLLAQRITSMSPNNMKAWYRQATALIEIQEFEEALKATETGQRLVQESLGQQENEQTEKSQELIKTLNSFKALEMTCRKKMKIFEENAKKTLEGFAKRMQKGTH